MCALIEGLRLVALCLALIVMMLALAPAKSGFAQELTGKPRVLDGDTIEIAGQPIRLAGADAPPANAICGALGHEWRCGQEATFALAYAVAEHWVTCVPRDEDALGILVARCKVGPYDLAERMIADGWAMAVGGYDFAESIAKRERKGIWRDDYVPPPGWIRR
jgi:endonuclease YncB( thermonuclease family)